MALHPGQEVFGYTVCGLLSESGFGTVYDGTDPNGVRVAIKFIPVKSTEPTALPVVSDRVARVSLPEELRVIRHILEHPHDALIRVIRYGHQGVEGGYAVVMEWAEQTLQHRLDAAIRAGEPIPVKEALNHLKRIADGLDYLAVSGFAHHDLKPANVLLVGGKAKVTDFGFAAAVQASLVSMSFRGTPHYLAPEVCDNKSAGNQSDQYSLAVLYCWLRWNESPYRELRGRDAPSLAAFVKAHTSTVADLQGLAAGELAAVKRALSKDPKSRFPTCSAFAAELARTVPVPPKPQRPNKFWRRRLLALNESIRTLGTRNDDLHRSVRELETQNGNLGDSLRTQGTENEMRRRRERRWRYATLCLMVLGLLGLGWLATMVVPSPPLVAAPPTRGDFERIERELAELEKRHLKLKRAASQLPSVETDFLNLDADEKPPLLVCTGPTGVNDKTVRAAQAAWAKFLGEASHEKAFALDKSGHVKIDMILIPPGKYHRGTRRFASPERSVHPGPGETPQAAITLTTPVWVGKYEVTQAQYAGVTGKENPSEYNRGKDRTGDYPVESVSYDEAVDFGKKTTDQTFRLLREAEWEYCCRAGASIDYGYGGTDRTIWKHAVYSGDRPARCGSKIPNAFGLYDMLGNVKEWCADWYSSSYYSRSPDSNPECRDGDESTRVLRGGSFASAGVFFSTPSARDSLDPKKQNGSVGFRVCLPVFK